MDALLIGLILLFASVLYWLSKGSAQRGVHANFKLDSGRYKLLGTDLGAQEVGSIFLSYAGVNGKPDAIFEDRKKPCIIVGEHKARKYKAGVRLREFYQVVLYMGIARRKWPRHDVKGLISFDDKVVWVDFDSHVFQALLDLKPEAIEGLRSGKASNPTPLHRRMCVRLPGGKRAA
ncbi:hypothetical protein [Stutzerimonas stutzeri]|uniref:hypothetical protein n=1 Tax=Stutzerimonas stutzeri TaxID=316 RepID=UPI001BCB5AAF|nr:hypothetical protein [Stutzerimonas stutzeri]